MKEHYSKEHLYLLLQNTKGIIPVMDQSKLRCPYLTRLGPQFCSLFVFFPPVLLSTKTTCPEVL